MSSHRQIFKSTALIGGAQAFSLVIGMVRTKLVAVLLGPSGVGLVGLYISATSLITTLAGLGIGNSGVREIADAAGSGDKERIGRTVRVLRRLCWVTGFLGAFLTVALAWPLSIWTFNSPEHVWPIMILGVTLLLGSISGGQTALIQGVRRIGDLAWLQILAALFGTVISVGLYAWLGKRGIVPVLVVSAAVNLGASWWFARRVVVPPANVTWRETFSEARGLVSLGLAFMLSGLLAAGVAIATRGLILRGIGIEANGLYQAAWGISGVFAGFILQAMGADFYPRLTAVAHDNAQINRIVNEQTEVGILLALPGLLTTLVFSSWIVRIMYSAKFTTAADLLPWFVLGIFGRVVSWPLGYIQLAKGAARWFAVTEGISSVLHIGFIWFGLQWLGLKGVAVAFAVLYGVYVFGMLWASQRLCGFRWSRSVIQLLVGASSVVVGTFLLVEFAPERLAATLGTIISMGSGVFCLRQICRRLGPGHRISLLVLRLPVIGRSLVPRD